MNSKTYYFLSIVILVLVYCITLTSAVNAQQKTTAQEIPAVRTRHDSESAKKGIKDIITGSEFHQKKEITHYKLKFLEDLFDFEKKERNEYDFSLGKYFKAAIKWVARSMEAIFWGLFFAIIIIIVYKYRHWLVQFAGLPEKSKLKESTPNTMFGLDIREESLPKNTPETVLKLWREGKKRKALSLLYRSTLSKLISKYAFAFPDSYTEQECMNLVSAANLGGLGDYFQTMTAQWQLLAYGHRFPESYLIESLCEKWDGFFESDNTTDNTGTAE